MAIPSVALNRKERTIGALHEVSDSIPAHGKDFPWISQLKMPANSLENNLTYYGTNEEDLKSKLAKLRAERTRIEDLFDCTRAQVADLREKLHT